MNTSRTPTTNAVLLAQLLERLERGGHPDADQYRLVVQRLGDELARIDDVDTLNGLLEAHPATAELYENLNYAQAGLCRSLLDASMASELRARDAIARARRQTTEGSAQG
jgi:hypothetical protein